MESGNVTRIGRPDFRNDNRLFGIKHEDRFSHLYIIGKTGTGKSTLLETMALFKKMWPEAWGVRMEHILRNVLMALLEQSSATLHDVLRVFSDNTFRKEIAKSLRN